MTGQTGREGLQFQQAGERRRRRPAPFAAVVMLLPATAAIPAFATQPRSVSAEAAGTAAAADAVVAELRELPLPLRPIPHGVASARNAPRPLPPLEVRRQHVYDELHALGPAAVAALARALRDPDPQMRRDVAVALDVVGGGWWHFPDGGPKLDLRPALPALLTALQDGDAGVRAWVAQDIGDMGAVAAAAVPGLRALLHRPDAGSRGNACSALGRLGSAARSALPDLQRARSDPSPEVRQAARAAIASIGRAEALP